MALAINDLLNSLKVATDDGRIEWKHNFSATSFTTGLRSYTIAIWEWTEPQEEISGVTIQLRDSKGTVLDALQADEFSPRYNELNELYKSARRSALKVGEVISELQAELNSLAKKEK